MSLGCAGCGGCCDPVHLAADQRDKVDTWRETVEDVWAGCALPPDHEITFILTHWHEYERYDGGARYTCDRFDADTRRCTAHDERPAVCRDFPFYGPIPIADHLESGADGEPACSYWLDVPADQRPEGVRPLIPLEVLR